jgi:hypothetical protein
MEFIIKKTHFLFLSIIPIILIFSYIKPKEYFDINIGDTYYVIRNSHLGILLSFFYFVLALSYWLTKKYEIILQNWVIYSHSIASILGLILIWFLTKRINNTPQNIEEIIKSIKINQYLIYTCITMLFLMLIVQVILFTEIVVKIVRR